MPEDLNAIRLTLERFEQRFSDFQTTVVREFHRINVKLDKIDDRLLEHDRRFEMIDKRFEEVDKRFDRLDRRFDALEKKVDLNSDKLDLLINSDLVTHSYLKDFAKLNNLKIA